MVSKPADEVEENEGRPPTARLLSFLTTAATSADASADAVASDAADAVADAAVAAVATEGEDNTFSDHWFIVNTIEMDENKSCRNTFIRCILKSIFWPRSQSVV